jgi:hypothetical protein
MPGRSVNTLIEFTYMVIRTRDKTMQAYTIRKIDKYIDAADRLINYLTMDEFQNRPDIFEFAELITTLTNRVSAVRRLHGTINEDVSIQKWTNTSFESFARYIGLESSPKFNVELHLDPLMQLTKYALKASNCEIGHVIRKDLIKYHLWFGELSFSLCGYMEVEPLLLKSIIDKVGDQIMLVYLLNDTLDNAFIEPAKNLQNLYVSMRQRMVLPDGWFSLYEISMKRMSERSAV